jgi:hypothetical protein
MTLDEYRRFFATHDVSGAPIGRPPTRSSDPTAGLNVIVQLAECLDAEQSGRLTFGQREQVRGILRAARGLQGLKQH